ncbi:carboxylesterase [Bacillus methanolicus]|uniref:alpha/beta hydrolase n=1 Tax=Bacillus methanolicus TaxID=1471 RepID=UPI00200E4D34|nr:alpha/beta fold hydrolase [Bacillus methanolicus]UQD50842.1 carboxylesterase [Bacillus methanolicus]
MIGCLCIHGFTGSPYEVEPLVDFLKEHTNWEIAAPTLPGHGETLQLKGVRYKDWIKHAEEELKKLMKRCETVYVIGFSMGGLIAAYLAVNYPVKKLVLLSAAAYYVNPKQLAADIGKMVKDTFRGELQNNDLFLRYKKKIKDTPISATFQFRTLVSNIRPILEKIDIPTFIAQGEADGIVPSKSAKYIYEKIGTEHKNIKYIKKSGHMICHCDENEELFSDILEFLSLETGTNLNKRLMNNYK